MSESTNEHKPGALREYQLSAIDRDIILATQGGLAISERPYLQVAQALSISEDEVIARLENMLAAGVIRRIAAVPNHYRIGFKANGMTVWDVDDKRIDELGQKIGALGFVSHCYQRPRHQPYWNYNLFAMVHGNERSDVEAKTRQLAEILGEACHGHEILYSSAILKKTGMRIRS